MRGHQVDEEQRKHFNAALTQAGGENEKLRKQEIEGFETQTAMHLPLLELQWCWFIHPASAHANR